jgi:hypothetical protein
MYTKDLAQWLHSSKADLTSMFRRRLAAAAVTYLLVGSLEDPTTS